MKHDSDLSKFKEYLEARVQPGTARVYTHALKMFLEATDGTNLTQKAAQSYIDHLTQAGKSASTVSLRGHAIMRWFKWKGTPIYLDCPTIRIGEPEYLSMPQFRKVLASCDTLLGEVLVTVLFDTAVRISELLGIELDDIDWENGFISVIRKGGRREEVNISAKATTVLERWIEKRESKSKRVFMDLQYWDAWSVIRRIGKRTEIKLHPHIFRHTRAIQMLMSGATLHDVQLHLGHRSIATTIDIYGRFKAIDLKKRVPGW